MMKKWLFLLVLVSNFIFSQSFYKTPSGKKFHLESCRMVKNVSQKITLSQVDRLGLFPCKICKPSYRVAVSKGSYNKAVGESHRTQRCKGVTKKGTRCRHRTSIANGYCFQHSNQGS